MYRITYEAYSKFANGINRCSNFPEIGKVVEKHLKYILNFHVIKLLIEKDNKLMEYSLCGNDIWFKQKNVEDLNEDELNLAKTGIPIRTSNIPKDIANGKLDLSKLKNPHLWSWLFNKDDHKMIVSLVADEERVFTSKDIEILKLAADCFDAKFKELNLKREIAKKNRILQGALTTIQQQNDEINKINKNQKEIIQKRTEEIVKKNEKLLKISVLNAHNVKEPLSRIQGIIELFDLMDDESCRQELLPRLKSSVKEMDEIVREVIGVASRELIELKAKNK
ncbi:histidine kinase [Zunongwangia pacifica]|uniref:Histidine kinase n=1 Tax=Zunongwangia pacifica TaxID=2911062 RepID=A0A9X1ZPZ5_9FLAO|nr:histidine kinase [Zunongwangia pacifica]MCL6217884.1 histidine kinase [Zunongwangia pacifica]